MTGTELNKYYAAESYPFKNRSADAGCQLLVSTC